MTKLTENIMVYYIFDEKDEFIVLELERHLIPLSRMYSIKSIFNVNSFTGFQIDDSFLDNNKIPTIVIPIVSANFFANAMCNKEYETAIANIQYQNIFIVPVIARNCYYEISDIAKFRVLPKSKIPVENWTNPADAYTEIIKSLEDLVKFIKENASKSNNQGIRSSEKDKYINIVLNDEFEKAYEALSKILVEGDSLLLLLKELIQMEKNSANAIDAKSHLQQLNHLRWNALKMIENIKL